MTPRIDVEDPSAALNEALAKNVVAFQRDFYICTPDQMRERWTASPEVCRIVKAIEKALPTPCREQLESSFIDHNPFWEYTRYIIYEGQDWDDATQKMVPMDEYYLEEKLHRNILCRKIYDYIINPTPKRIGLAIFITRFGTKTYVGCNALTSWLLTRHRVLFNDYITIRIIHDLEEEAVNRAVYVKTKCQRSKRLRELYPEIRLPEPWGKENAWDLLGCKDSGSGALDKQVTATGARSAQQGKHPRITIIDDLESERHKESPAAVRETKNAFRGFSFSERIGASKKILLGTFYNPDSVHNTIVENAERAERGEDVDPRATWEVIRLPAILNEGTENEELLYPKRLSYEEIEKKKQECILDTGNDLDWRMQMQLDFAAASVFRFQMDQWNLLSLAEPETEFEDRIVSALNHAPLFSFGDFAAKDEESRGRGDWNAIWVVAFPVVDGRVHRVYIDAHYDNISTLTEICKRQLELSSLYDVWWVVAEESPAHKVVATELTRVSAEMGLQYFRRFDKGRKVYEGNIITIRPKAGTGRGVGNISAWKANRINKFQNAFNNTGVWFNDSIDPEILDAMHQQAISYPFIKRDDLLDAASQPDNEDIAHLIPAPRIKQQGLKRRRTPPRPVLLPRTGLT